MSLRRAKNKLTGRPTHQPVITLGYRTDGTPGVTVHVNYEKGYGSYVNPDILVGLIADLEYAIDHLNGEDVARFLE